MNSKPNGFRDERKFTMSGFSRVLLALTLVLIGLAEAHAQQPGDQSPPAATLLPGIEVLPTPYLWFP